MSCCVEQERNVDIGNTNVQRVVREMPEEGTAFLRMGLNKWCVIESSVTNVLYSFNETKYQHYGLC